MSTITDIPSTIVPLCRRNEGPATYHEFLARTSGQLLHEPPASRRGPQDSHK